MGPLVLIWDGLAVVWCTNTGSGEVGRRTVSRFDMIPEVLKALRNQVGTGMAVMAGEWGSPATVMPSSVFQDNGSPKSVRPWFELHHGHLRNDHDLQVHHFDNMQGTPCLAVEGSSEWAFATRTIFPQCREIPVLRALVHDAIQWNRRNPIEGWVIRVDVRNHGAVFVATQGEALMWVHNLRTGLTSDDCLYAMVNAVHRSGVEVGACQVIWSGMPELTDGWDRFFQVTGLWTEGRGGSESWLPIIQSLTACV